MFRSQVPLGRIGDPMGMSNAVLFLCPPRSRCVTGQEVAVDGDLLGLRPARPYAQLST
ncbi:SDR family oxidoreductase [Micromonospora sp. NPDC051196]|uniref:SDR family oxidoreductase n=1 Tax=Micromonospora sp. NPDC051196 TaxID=3155281 RepID=UPI0034373F75